MQFCLDFKDSEIRNQITAPFRNTGVIWYFFEGANLHVTVFRPQKETCEVRTFRHFKQLVAINAPQELSNDSFQQSSVTNIYMSIDIFFISLFHNHGAVPLTKFRSLMPRLGA
jgi:hypothetical protein